MAEYTPTTDEVREDFAFPWSADQIGDRPARVAAFDRWLANYTAKVRADERDRIRRDALDVTVTLKQRTGGHVEYIEADWLRQALDADTPEEGTPT